jgi:hypothetical protein
MQCSTYLAQGVPRNQCPANSFDDAELRDLAGNGFNAAVCSMIVGAFFVNPYGDWWKRDV